MSSSARSLVPPSRRVGRYVLHDEVGHGGTATVHIGRLLGPAGFSKTVAIKQMREYVGRDPAVVAMFLDEARLSGRIRHPNVVATSDLLSIDGDLFLVMEYVHGESLAALQNPRGVRSPLPPSIAVHVMLDALAGLHAAHEALDEAGQPLGLVHRDVSPQNIQVGIDGVARVLDFGIAKALGRLQDTHTGQVKGKLAYMAPEQLLGQAVDRRTDVFAAGVVLWEAISGQRLFQGENHGETVQKVLSSRLVRLDEIVPSIDRGLSDAVARAISRDVNERFATALEMARALEETVRLVSARQVGDWVTERGGERLRRRSERLRIIETSALDAPDVAPDEDEPPSSGRTASSSVETLGSIDAAALDDGVVDETRTDVTAIVPRISRPFIEENLVAAGRASRADNALDADPSGRNKARRRLFFGIAALVSVAAMALVVRSLSGSSAVNESDSGATHSAQTRTGRAEAAEIAAPRVIEAPAASPVEAPAAAPVVASQSAAKDSTPRAAASASSAPTAVTKPKVKAAATKSKPAAARPSKGTEAPKRAEDLFSRN